MGLAVLEFSHSLLKAKNCDLEKWEWKIVKGLGNVSVTVKALDIDW